VRTKLEYRDESKHRYAVFFHGYSVSEGGAEFRWGNELFKRLFWLGYRDNFVAITWRGDPVLYDTAVDNALHTSPSVLDFIRNTVEGGWGVAPQNLNMIAHSLGNLVMWDTLRLHQWASPGTKLVNNVLSIEAAVWPEAFNPVGVVEYLASDGDLPAYYGPNELLQHSWSFWFRQPGHEASVAAGGVFHSWVSNDSALFAMQFNDWFFRGLVVPAWKHVDRSQVGETPRTPDTLARMPTFLEHKRHHIPYGPTALNRPVGAMPQPLGSAARSVSAVDFGWRPQAHSDLRDVPLYQVYKWYKEVVGEALSIPKQ